MSEQYERCRFTPHCAIHLGEPRPRLFSEDNRLEMFALRRQGWLYVDIAHTFGTSPGQAARIVESVSQERLD